MLSVARKVERKRTRKIASRGAIASERLMTPTRSTLLWITTYFYETSELLNELERRPTPVNVQISNTMPPDANDSLQRPGISHVKSPKIVRSRLESHLRERFARSSHELSAVCARDTRDLQRGTPTQRTSHKMWRRNKCTLDAEAPLRAELDKRAAAHIKDVGKATRRQHFTTIELERLDRG